jgi:cytoskeletal protein CcmA (bactofilin family)
MFGKKSKVDLSKLNSIIAKGMKISGTIQFTGTMKISGNVDGIIKGPEEIEVGSADSVLIIDGIVTSQSITADHIVVTGVVKAEQVIAAKSLIIISGGKFFVDDAKYGSLTIDDTATVSANLSKIVNETAGLTVEM